MQKHINGKKLQVHQPELNGPQTEEDEPGSQITRLWTIGPASDKREIATLKKNCYLPMSDFRFEVILSFDFSSDILFKTEYIFGFDSSDIVSS